MPLELNTLFPAPVVLDAFGDPIVVGGAAVPVEEAPRPGRRRRATPAEQARSTSPGLAARRRWKLTRRCCSSAWADAVWHEGAEYPPGGPASTMRRCGCEGCGKDVPPQYLTSSGACWDCYYAGVAPAEPDAGRPTYAVPRPTPLVPQP